MIKTYCIKLKFFIDNQLMISKFFKLPKILRYRPVLILFVVAVMALFSGCSVVNFGSNFSQPDSETLFTVEPILTRTLFVPQFIDTNTPSPTIKLDGIPTTRPSWTPNISSLQPTLTFLPTNTLRPTWTATITPTPTTTPQIGLLLTENFSDPSAQNWLQKSSSNWATWISNGVYAMNVLAPYVEISSGPSWLKIDEVALEVDVIRKQGNGYFGFACRESGSSYYTIFISTEGYFGFGETRSGSVTFLNTTPTKLINTSVDAVNHIRGECRGDTLTLYINGTLAGQQKVAGLGPGYVSILTGTTWDHDKILVHFDNLQIWTPANPVYHPRPTSTSTATLDGTITATATATATP